MASLREALKAHLEANTALMTQIPGGVFMAEDLMDQNGFMMSKVPKQSASSTRIARFMTIRARPVRKTELQTSRRRDFEFYVYDEKGYIGIEEALRLLEFDLDRTIIKADHAGPNMFHFSYQSGEVDEPSLGYRPCMFSRFYVDYSY